MVAVARLERGDRELEGQAAARSATAPPPAPATAPTTGATPAAATLAASPDDPVVRSGLTPVIESADGRFSFKPRGMLHLDYAGYRERAGGYDYNNGTDVRRGRFGFEGTAFGAFRWRLDAEYVRNEASILDAYVSYIAIPDWQITVGQHKTPYGLEPNTSDTANTFIERGMFTNAFGAVGAERREGVSIGYFGKRFTGAIGLFGSGEAVTRDANTPDEAYGVNARLTWDPILAEGRVLHLGIAGYEVRDLAENSVVVADRPGSRVDGGRIVSAAVADARLADYYGAEAAAVFGPVSVQGEYGRLRIQRFRGLRQVGFAGYYVFGSLFLTGESRSFRQGVVDRVKPRRDFSPDGDGLGAFELAVRYDRLDLTDRDLSPLPMLADSWTAGANWYLNPHLRLAVNYIRARGINSPLVVDPAIEGTTAKVDIFASRLQFDF